MCVCSSLSPSQSSHAMTTPQRPRESLATKLAVPFLLSVAILTLYNSLVMLRSFEEELPDRASNIPARRRIVPLRQRDISAIEFPPEWLRRFDEATLRQSQEEAETRAAEVRAEIKFAWDSYAKFAFGKDDLLPLSHTGSDWAALGVQILDALSTLYLADLREDFEAATMWVARELDLRGQTYLRGGLERHKGAQNLFEMTIRGLGGLLSAYALSGDPILLSRASDLGARLSRAFDVEGSHSGFPFSKVDIASGRGFFKFEMQCWQKATNIAEAGTLQLEFAYLASVNATHAVSKAHAYQSMESIIGAGHRGLSLTYLDPLTASFARGSDKITLGAMGDSYYEYLLKTWLLAGKPTTGRERRFLDQWLLAMADIFANYGPDGSPMPVTRPGEGLWGEDSEGRLFLGEWSDGAFQRKMDHLACFAAGMLVLGYFEVPADLRDDRWLDAGQRLGRTCYEMYQLTPTGISPEHVEFPSGGPMIVPDSAPHYVLRPEAVEALFYLHYYTGDPKYRDWAYDIFSALKRYCRTESGYAAIEDVRELPPRHRNSMESFFIAETLKYLYLTFSPPRFLDLSEYVFNTEAHPLRRAGRSEGVWTWQ